MPINRSRAKTYIREFQFTPLFIEELGWDRCSISHTLTVGENTYQLNSIAEKCGLVVFHCLAAMDKEIPDYSTRRKIEKDIAKFHHEHLIVFSNAEQTFQIWQWIRREPGRPDACREHRFGKGQPGESLVQKLEQLAFTFEQEEAGITLFDVTDPVRRAFDVDRVTKKFYDRFKKEHDNFREFIQGIKDITELNWYTSIMLNRLMFVYFIQKKGFLDGDKDYLRNRLQRCRKELGKGKFQTFYRYFLIRLFHEGLGQKEKDRDPALQDLLGKVPFLNGGLFDVHQLEESHPDLNIPDEAFAKLFDFFDAYHWHLDERPLRADNEINPDVLGYIFEKYINQKQMGAYYTKEDITEYIGKNTIIPFLFDAARAKCKIAFEADKARQGQDTPAMPTVWDLLKQDPDRYIYKSVRRGVIDEDGKVIPESVLPDFVRTGMNDPKARMFDQRYNLGKADLTDADGKELTLPTETWREYVNRRRRCLEIRKKLRNGDVREINDLITLNLNIRQFAQDILADCDSPDLLRAFWKAIEKVTILDPTCGSGAFLFAALNILEPLYETCLQRMEAFLEDLERSGKKHRPEKFSDFRDILEQVEKHPNHRYFILKSIILNNLYGVDIMAEAVEICKLRLFLKLAAQVDPDYSHGNLGLEPLPDIDFNIRCGNTLVGFAKFSDFENAGSGKLDFDNAKQKISVRAADVQQAFDVFRARQMVGDGSVPIGDKQNLHQRLKALEDDLNRWLAGEYGVDSDDEQEYEQWLKSHQPFHWFIEFYGIMKEGGFDVIIGNPPYVEYSKVSEYGILCYKTERCANLYVFTLERSFSLHNSNGRLGMIVPVSVACSGAMQPIRNLMNKGARFLWLSHFSNRPGQIFNGAQNRLTIVITSGKTGRQQFFSTKYNRWDAKNGEREGLLPALRFQEINQDAYIFEGIFPKIGCPEAWSVFQKISQRNTIDELIAKQGKYKIYWVRVPGYFCVFLLDPPLARPQDGGEPRIRGEVNNIGFDYRMAQNVVHCVLNSAVYYQYFCAYTDTRHINPSDVRQFPLDLASFSDAMKSDLAVVSGNLSKCFRRHTTQWRKSGLLIDSIETKLCKRQIDEIDCVLAKHYGFTDEELDFIINYDIKYRMGGAVEMEDEV